MNDILLESSLVVAKEITIPCHASPSNLWGLGKFEESAIALLEKHSKHPATKGIVENIINGAKANTSESELEEIKRLEDQTFEF